MIGKALINVAPDDLSIAFSGSAAATTSEHSLVVTCTIHNRFEAEAVREIINHLSQHWLSAHREMVRGDIMPAEPEPNFKEGLAAMFGTYCDSDQNPKGGNEVPSRSDAGAGPSGHRPDHVEKPLS
ncbi:MAG: hypothetical protein V4530_05920 [Pseudomonadota bacterium]